MSGHIAELTALVHKLVANVGAQADDMQTVRTTLTSLSRTQVLDSADSASTVIRTPIIVLADDNYVRMAPSSTLRDLGKDIPTLTANNYSFWKAHMRSYDRAAGDWGTAAIPEVFTDPAYPRGTTAKELMWSKCNDVLKC